MTTVTTIKNRESIAAAVGTTYYSLSNVKFPMNVNAVPGVSAGVTISYSCDVALADAATGTYVAWSAGAAASNTTVAQTSPVVLMKVVVTTAASIVNIVGSN